MYKITRTAPPKSLTINHEAWNQRYQADKASTPAKSFRWYNAACYQETRELLISMTQGHCAFCDGPLGAESRETIEHFKPKSAFPELAFTWENLFPCCDRCQGQKLEKYDDALLKPDDVTYEFERFFIANYATGEITPSPQACAVEQHQAQVTIEHYGLNLPQRKLARRKELKCYFAMRHEMILDEFNYRYFLME
ncbi:TIGR02646 family protein [Yersinia mollaretii]|uniref:retron system putative HNH endonuclease n=1 Tax=Yersinia mollaretii TaxID=33060 RepID=UPI001427B98F|nr:retron system putative HNH endonuclease [Yersinia mollaretii]MDA5536112.1 TIGR02646 family protein [Yersinia mollaretii]NIL04376.1 TIGR02646 family protein [Yersinia mollaretii]